MKNKEKIIGSIAILCISIIFIIAGYTMSSPKESTNAANYKDIFVENNKTSEEKHTGAVIATNSNKVEESNTKVDNSKVEDINIKVDIKGAVKEPGVYEIKKGSRVTDLIKLAGGGTKEADLDATNLSSKLNDEDCIVISKKGETNKTQVPQNTSLKSGTIKGTTKDSAVSSANSNEAGAIIRICCLYD